MTLPNRHVPPILGRPQHINRFAEVHRQAALAKGTDPESTDPRIKASLLPMATRIKNARKALDMTQTDMAQHLGCSTPYISQIETGRCGLGKYQEAIFELLNIQPEERA